MSQLVPGLLLTSGLRFYRRHPGHLLLTIAGIALGVAAVLAIDLASYSARQAFEASTTRLRGLATHELTRPGGELPASLLRELRTRYGVPGSMPVVEGRLRFARWPARSWSVVGIDPLSLARLGAGAGARDSAKSPGIASLMTATDAVWISGGLAKELGLRAGDELELVEPAPGRLTVQGIFAGDDDAYLLADIATAQEILRRYQGLSRIDLRLDQPGQVEALRELEAQGYRLQTVAARVGQLDAVTRAFRVNLQALSLLTLLVGAFLVYSTVVFAVVRRREQFGLMRSLGASRRQVFALILSETAALAIPATVLGLLFGTALGAGLVKLVLRTIGDLYLIDAVDYYGLSGALIGKAAFLGIAASLGAALLPALEAARVTPRVNMNRGALERRVLRSFGPRLLVAALLAVFGALLLWFTRRLEPAFVGIFSVLIAIALSTPVLVHAAMGFLGAGASRARWLTLAYAARSVQANLSRTGPAAAALMIAIAAFTGIGVMIGSFRASVDDWLSYSLDADVLLRYDRSAPGEADRLVGELRAWPMVRGVTLSQRLPLPDREGLAGLLVIDPAPQAGRWPKTNVDRASVLEALQEREQVIVSQPFARKRGLGPGDEVRLFAQDGQRSFTIAAIFVDYSSDQGLVAMHRKTYERYFGLLDQPTVGLFANPGQAQALLAASRELAADNAQLRVTSSAFLRDLSLQVFDRTFTITQVLRFIAGLVAVIAIVNALQAQRLDSRREVATLRAMGMSPGRLLWLTEFQTALLGACAGVLALPVGLLLAWLLIVVVNRLAFGWDMLFLPQPMLLLQGFALAVLAALAAGIWPARQALRTPPALALREE